MEDEEEVLHTGEFSNRRMILDIDYNSVIEEYFELQLKRCPSPYPPIGVLTLVGFILDKPNSAATIPLSVIFNGRNFPEWRQRIQDVLIKERIWQKVLKVNRPMKKGKELDDFLEDQMIAKSIIRGYIEAEYLHYVDTQDHELSVEEVLDKMAQKCDWKTAKNSKFAFVIANCATHHVINDPYLARNFKPCRAKLLGAFGPTDFVIATARGDLTLRSKEGYAFKLKNVLFAPTIKNFFSIMAIPLALSCSGGGMELMEGKKVIASGESKNSLINANRSKECCTVAIGVNNRCGIQRHSKTVVIQMCTFCLASCIPPTKY